MKKLLTLILSLAFVVTFAQQQFTYSGNAAGTNTYTASITNLTTYGSTRGVVIDVHFDNASTGAATLNINGLGAIDIAGVTSGTIAANTTYHLAYNIDTGDFDIVGGSGGSGGGEDLAATLAIGDDAGAQNITNLSLINGTKLDSDELTFNGSTGSVYAPTITYDGSTTTLRGGTLTHVNGFAELRVTTPLGSTGTTGKFLGSNGAGAVEWLTPAGSGTVTSVGLSLPSFITVSGSPVTTSGTLTGTLATQTANTVFSGPASGSAAAPTFRALGNTDLPNIGRTVTTSTSLTQSDDDATLYCTPSGGINITVDQLSQYSTVGIINNSAFTITFVNGSGVTSAGVSTVAAGGTAVVSYVSATAPIITSGGSSLPITTTGDLIQSTSGTTAGRLAAVATGNALISGGVGTVNSWGKITSSHIDATVLAAADGWLTNGSFSLLGNTTIGGNFNKYFSGTGAVVIGHTALTNSNARLQVRGVGSSTNNMVLFESQAGTALFTMTDAGVVTWPAFVNNTWTGPVNFNGTITAGVNIADNRSNAVIIQSSSGTASNRNLQIGNGTYSTLSVLGQTQNTFSTNGSNVITQGAYTSAWLPALKVTPGAHTSMGAGGNYPDVDFAFNRTVSQSTGSSALQNWFIIRQPTHAFVASSTVNDESNLTIEGAAVAGPNATLTNNSAIWVKAGAVGSGTTNSYGATIQTQTGGTNNYAARFLGGNVGIGNSAPTEVLDVTGNVRFSGALMPNNTAGTSGQVLTSAGAGTVPTWTNQGSRNLDTNTSTVSNSGTGEDDLYRFSVPASTLSTNGNSIEAKFSGSLGNSGANKTIKAYFGTTLIFNSGTFIISSGTNFWTMNVQVIRTGAATQKCNVTLLINNSIVANFVSYIATTETLSGALDLAVTGEISVGAGVEITKETAKVLLVQ